MNTTTAVLNALKKCSRCGAELNEDNGAGSIEPCSYPRSSERTSQRRLTTREQQVVGLIQFGKLNKEIAWELHLTEGTVKEYLNRIFRKLDVKNRTELAVWALTRQIAG